MQARTRHAIPAGEWPGTGSSAKEILSAAMDCELDASSRDQLFALCEDDGNRQDWLAWHVIGDTLRQTPACGDLTARVARQLAGEPTVLAPRRKRPTTRYLMPLAASVAAVALVSWSALHVSGGSTPTPATLAANSAPAARQVAMSSPPVQSSGIDKARLAGYLASHRDFAAGSNASAFMDATWQVPTGSGR
ncbi:MAG: RseA family anti-sigma factor [Betaproteobacteria bacterium]|nr:RseA family anti-sigma factor [Betaproteobacteria bacterium]